MPFIGHYAARSGEGIGRSSYTVSNIGLIGQNRAVLAIVNQRSNTRPNITVTFQGLPPGGVLRDGVQNPGFNNWTWVYYWLDVDLPPNAPNQIVTVTSDVLFDNNANLGSCVVAVGNGVDQLKGITADVIDYTTGTSITTPIFANPTDILYDYICKRHADDEATPDASQTLHINLEEEFGGANAAYRVYTSEKSPADISPQMAWTFSVAGREITHWVAALSDLFEAEFFGVTRAAPGMQAAGTTDIPEDIAEFSGTTIADPAMQANGDGTAGFPPAAFSGQTNASPGMRAGGTSIGVVVTRGGTLVLRMQGTGTGAVATPVLIIGAGAHQAERATHAGFANTTSSIQGFGTHQAERATQRAVGFVGVDFESQGTADAWVETYIQGGVL